MDSSSDRATPRPIPASAPPRAGAREWAGLAALLGPVLLVAMDSSVLFVALPQLSEALDPTPTQMLWILDIYSFMVAPLLITTGNLGDRYGRRRLLAIGSTIFGIGSVLAAFAPTAEALIAARVLLGIGGGALLPTTLGVISALFADERQRSRAIGLWTAAFSAGFALGPVIGGLLLQHFWWGSVFLINVPVVAAFLIAAPMVIPAGTRNASGRIDLLSIPLSILGVLSAVFAIKELAARGPTFALLAAAIVGSVSIWQFLRRQRMLPEALLDTSLFRRPVFAIAILTAFVSTFAFSAAGYLGNVYLQVVAGLSPLQAGLTAVIPAVVVATFSIASGPLVRRIGTRTAVIAALGFIVIGLAIYAFTGLSLGIAGYIVGVGVMGVGTGVLFSLASETAIGSVPSSRAGSAGAISETAFELGLAGGIALLGSLAGVVFRAVSGADAADIRQGVAEAGSALQLAAAHEAFGWSLFAAALAAAALALAVAGLAVRMLPRAST